MRRAEQVNATREALLTAAERLFAERGVHAVGNRDISQAAEQGNNAAVVYHFGTRADLVRAIARRHAEPIARIRQRIMADAQSSGELRDWVSCLVRPLTEHLDMLGSPTWYARFIAQVWADPALGTILTEESLDITPALRDLQPSLARCLPHLPEEVREERALMARHLVIQVAVEREQALAAGTPLFRTSWADTADGLVDAIAGLWQAPVNH